MASLAHLFQKPHGFFGPVAREPMEREWLVFEFLQEIHRDVPELLIIRTEPNHPEAHGPQDYAEEKTFDPGPQTGSLEGRAMFDRSHAVDPETEREPELEEFHLLGFRLAERRLETSITLTETPVRVTTTGMELAALNLARIRSNSSSLASQTLSIPAVTWIKPLCFPRPRAMNPAFGCFFSTSFFNGFFFDTEDSLKLVSRKHPEVTGHEDPGQDELLPGIDSDDLLERKLRKAIHERPNDGPIVSRSAPLYNAVNQQATRFRNQVGPHGRRDEERFRRSQVGF